MSRWFKCFRGPSAADSDCAPPEDVTPPEQLSQNQSADFSSKLDFLRNVRKSDKEPDKKAKPAAAPKCDGPCSIIAATIFMKENDQAYVCATHEDLSQFSFLYRRQAGEFIR